jgi:hypothetical protein
MLTVIASHLQNPRDIFAFTGGSRALHRVDPLRTPVLRDFGRTLQEYEHAALTADPSNKVEIKLQRDRRELLDRNLNMVPLAVRERYKAAQDMWARRRTDANIQQARDRR